VGEYAQCPIAHQGEPESLDTGVRSGCFFWQEPVGKTEERPPGPPEQQEADDHSHSLDSATKQFLTLGLSGCGPENPFQVDRSLDDRLRGERVKDPGRKSREKSSDYAGREDCPQAASAQG